MFALLARSQTGISDDQRTNRCRQCEQQLGLRRKCNTMFKPFHAHPPRAMGEDSQRMSIPCGAFNSIIVCGVYTTSNLTKYFN